MKIKKVGLMDIKSRKANLKDKSFIYNTKKEALFSYVDAIWGWDEVYQKSLFNKNLNIQNIQILTNNTTPIGIIELEENEEVIDLVNIELIPEFRNKGIGSSEINKLISHASNSNKLLQLRVFKKNNKAIKLYKKIGFSEYGLSEYHINLQLKPVKL